MDNHTLKLDIECEGRHLVVGDVHGQYKLLLKLLDQINYDQDKDILYSVGDLIDRGPRSIECVEFFNQPRRYAIKGNHEVMMLVGGHWHSTWLDNGGYKVVAQMQTDRSDINMNQFCDMIEDWPMVIDVGEDDDPNAFRIVHAEMPADWSEEDFQDALDRAHNEDSNLIQALLWSRKLIKQGCYNIGTLKPAHYQIDFNKDRCRDVIVGHTPLKKVLCVGDHWFIDTGAGGVGPLTIIDAITKQTFSATNDDFSVSEFQ